MNKKCLGTVRFRGRRNVEGRLNIEVRLLTAAEDESSEADETGEQGDDAARLGDWRRGDNDVIAAPRHRSGECAISEVVGVDLEVCYLVPSIHRVDDQPPVIPLVCSGIVPEPLKCVGGPEVRRAGFIVARPLIVA